MVKNDFLQIPQEKTSETKCSEMNLLFSYTLLVILYLMVFVLVVFFLLFMIKLLFAVVDLICDGVKKS